jgi:hypothetical protein
MITEMDIMPDNVVGFMLGGEVSKQDYEEVVFPAIQRLNDKQGKINMVMVLKTSIKNFKMGAWVDDAKLGLKNLFKWNRIAVVSDEFLVRIGIIAMNRIIPGEYKYFPTKAEAKAIEWASERG